MSARGPEEPTDSKCSVVDMEATLIFLFNFWLPTHSTTSLRCFRSAGQQMAMTLAYVRCRQRSASIHLLLRANLKTASTYNNMAYDGSSDSMMAIRMSPSGKILAISYWDDTGGIALIHSQRRSTTNPLRSRFLPPITPTTTTSLRTSTGTTTIICSRST